MAATRVHHARYPGAGTTPNRRSRTASESKTPLRARRLRPTHARSREDPPGGPGLRIRAPMNDAGPEIDQIGLLPSPAPRSVASSPRAGRDPAPSRPECAGVHPVLASPYFSGFEIGDITPCRLTPRRNRSYARPDRDGVRQCLEAGAKGDDARKLQRLPRASGSPP